MLDIAIIFKLATLGIGIAITNKILKKVDAEEWAFPITIIAIVIAFIIVIQYLTQFFNAIQTMMTF
ncbi:MAG: SpoIIIAC/SpoIIIAD family protein [Cellulosilyticaceae bacterium]